MTSRESRHMAARIPHSRPPSATVSMYMLWGVLTSLVNVLLAMFVSDIRGYLPLGYLSQVAIFAALNMSRHNYSLIRLLQPSMIAIIYIGLSCSVGAWAFYSGNVANIMGKSYYDAWSNLKETYAVISVGLLFLYALSLRGLGLPTSDAPPADHKEENALNILATSSVLLLFIFASSFLTVGILSQLKTVIAAALFYVLFRHDAKYKWFFSALAIGILAAMSPQSKREAIFAIPAMILITLAYYPRTKFTINKLLVAIASVVLIGLLILAMSILRGYGGFNASGFVEAIKLVPQYLSMTNSLGFMFNNFEVSSLFLHLHQCVSSILEMPGDMAFGETYIRVLLVWPIGDLMGYKPASIIDQYTATFFPSFRDEGGSFVVTSFGEAAWNFGWFAPVALLLIYFALDKLFAWSVRSIRMHGAFGTIFALNLFQYSLYYSRGSGLDIMVIYLLFSAGCGLLIALALKMLQLDSGRRRRRSGIGIPQRARGSRVSSAT